MSIQNIKIEVSQLRRDEQAELMHFSDCNVLQ
jgi:hypothetical protein